MVTRHLLLGGEERENVGGIGEWELIKGSREGTVQSISSMKGLVSQGRGPGLEEHQVKYQASWSLEPYLHRWRVLKCGDKPLLEMQFGFRNIIF